MKKKCFSLLLAVVLLFTLFNGTGTVISTVHAVFGGENGNSIVLSPSDYTLTVMNSSAVIDTDGETLKLTKNYPVFRIGFPELYYLKSVKVTFTAAGHDGNIPLNSGGFKILSDGSPVTLGPNYSSVRISPNTTTQKTFTIPEDYQYTQAEGLQFALNFTSPSEDITLHIDSIELVGAPLTETIELTGSDIVLNRINNCTVDENTVVSAASQYPQFYLDFGKDYYIRKITVTATAAGKGYSTSNDKITLRKDGEIVTALGWSYQSFAMDTTSSKTKAIAADYQTMAVNQVYFLGTWASKPGAGEATLTIESVTITVWRIPKRDITVSDSEFSVSPVSQTTVDGKIITASGGSPKFRITLSEPAYMDSVDIAINNTYTSALGWLTSGTRNYVSLEFSDGSSVLAEVSRRAGESYWFGTISADSTKSVQIVIPEDYKDKKLASVLMSGYFTGNDRGEGSLTITDVTLNGVTDAYISEIINQINSPITISAGITAFESVNSFYQNVISEHISFELNLLQLVSVYMDDDTTYGLYGKPVVIVTLPNLNGDSYISEIGIIGLPSVYVSETELTLETDGILKISKSCEESEDLTDYSVFSLPIAIGMDFADTEMALRAYIKISDGEEEQVLYSENDNPENGIENGTAIFSFPDAQIVGDANSDGCIDILDLVRLKRYFGETAAVLQVCGDSNVDGDINTQDLTTMVQCLLGVTELPQEANINEFFTSDIWKTTIDGRTFTKNISRNTFDESDYTNNHYSGGTDIRTEDYIRGMGMTTWHATEGWNLSAETKAIDAANLEELNVTSKRTWGEGVSGTLNTDYDYATSLSVSNILDRQQFSDGTESTTAYQWVSNLAARKILNNWRSLLNNSLVRNQNRILLLGNEYRIYYQNKTTGKYEYSGYDATTLNDFRNNWCATRFGTIGILNSLCGTTYTSFAEVYPTSSNRLLWYEFWLYQRQSFRTLMGNVLTGMKQSYPDTKWGYAGYSANNGPLTNNLYLDGLDYTSQNFYYGSQYMQDFHDWSFGMDNLAAWSKTAPVVVTETGFRNGTTAESQNEVARRYKQFLNLFYMRPRYVGSYLYNYTSSSIPNEQNTDSTWGMVDPYRNKYPAFYAVKQVYSDFNMLDSIYTGASNTPLVAITNLATDNKMTGSSRSSALLASVLYAKGVPVQVVPSDDSTRFDTLKENKLICNDNTLYQNPNGSGSVGASLVSYLNGGGKVFRSNTVAPRDLYGVDSGFTEETMAAITAKFSGLTVSETEDSDKKAMWKELGKFIHEDFVSGEVSVKANTIDENAVRILDVESFSSSLTDCSFDIETKMVYKDGNMYLCLVNLGDSPIESVDITIGVNQGVKCNLSPSFLCGDSGTSVFRQNRAYTPSWIDASIESVVDYGTVSVKNLDAYAYVYIGKAVLES